MRLTRRSVLKTLSLASCGIALGRSGIASAELPTHVMSTGNPVIPNVGACDPQVRVYDDHVYMYSTHDASLDNTNFLMNDWWVWHTTDLVNWEMVSVLKPEQTYFGKPSTQCWATDAVRRANKYYFYFSMGPEDVGVVMGDSPAGPWHDPLKHALIAKGSVKTQARDPGILQDADGTNYIVFGTFDYYISRLNDDMISLAEEPRLIHIANPQGPYGPGKTDDKPFLHRRGNKYYLSWGCYYAIGESPYGPYECKGSIIQSDRLAPEFRDVSRWKGPKVIPAAWAPKDWLGLDRHGSFFELFGQWYFICNDQALPGTSPFFRNAVLSYVRYKQKGEIDPVRITTIGVGQYDARVGMDATDFFKSSGAVVRERSDGSFEVGELKDGSHLIYPKVRNLKAGSRLTISGRSISTERAQIEVRRGDPTGRQLGKTEVAHGSAQRSGPWQISIPDVRGTDDLCIVFRSGSRSSRELAAIEHLSFT